MEGPESVLKGAQETLKRLGKDLLFPIKGLPFPTELLAVALEEVWVPNSKGGWDLTQFRDCQYSGLLREREFFFTPGRRFGTEEGYRESLIGYSHLIGFRLIIWRFNGRKRKRRI